MTSESIRTHKFRVDFSLILIFFSTQTNSPSSSLKVKTTDEVKFQILIPIWSVLIRDYAWSSNGRIIDTLIYRLVPFDMLFFIAIDWQG